MLPQAPTLSPGLPDSPSTSPELPSPSLWPGVTLDPRGGGSWALGTDSPACPWVLKPTLSAGRESPVRGLPSALSSASPPWEPPGPWGPLREQAGWGGSLQTRAPPAPPHLTKAEQGGEGGGHGVSSLQSRP